MCELFVQISPNIAAKFPLVAHAAHIAAANDNYEKFFSESSRSDLQIKTANDKVLVHGIRI